MRPLLTLLRHPPPWHRLGSFPSPIAPLPDLARAIGAQSLVVKRDDLNGAEFGGNKLRALEFLLAAKGGPWVTMGGYGSTWCAGLSYFAAGLGQRTYLALFPQPWTSAVSGALSRTLESGEVYLARTQLGLPVALARAWRAARKQGRPRWLPAGGAAPLGILGSVNAALEFVEQVSRGEAERPDAVVVPLGSGGTAAGLLLGFGLVGWPVEICAVRVTDPWFANRRRVLRLANRALRLLQQHGLTVAPSAARLRVITDQLGPGYGHPTEPARQAQADFAASKVTLELTYGAKTAAALARVASSFPRLCFWHTFDSRLVSGAPADHPELQQARTQAELLWPHLKSI